MYITKTILVPDLKATDGKRTLEIYSDQDGPSPREYDCLGTIVSWNRETTLGGKQIKEQYEFDLVLLDILDDAMHLSEEQRYNVMEYADASVLMNAIKKHTKAVVLPIYLYSHGGISVSTNSNRYRMFDSAGWDWGTSGIIYATETRIKKEHGCTEISDEIVEKTEKVLEDEVKTLDMYYKGEVYVFITKDGDEVEDSLGGIYAEDLKTLREELKPYVEDKYTDLIDKLEYCQY